MCKNIIKYTIKETKYELTSISMIKKVFFIIGCIILSGSFFVFHEIWYREQPFWFCFIINGIVAYTNKEYIFGEDVYQLLPLSKKEYRWLFIIEGIPFQFVVSAIAALFTFPSIIMQGNLSILVNCFVSLLSMGLWFKQMDWIRYFSRLSQTKKHSKLRIYQCIECIIAFLYIGTFGFNVASEFNPYLNAFLSVVFIFITLAISLIIRIYEVNKVEEFCN